MAFSVADQGLLDAFVALAGQEDRSQVLQQVIGLACQVTGANSGAAFLRGEEHSTALAQVGMTTAEVEDLSPYPVVCDVLAGARADGPDPIGNLVRSRVLGADHCQVVNAVAVPIQTRGDTCMGTIYLTRPTSDGGFCDADVRFVESLGHLAGHTVALTPAISESKDLLRRLQVAERLGSHAVERFAGDDPRTGVDRILAVAKATLGLDLAFVTRLHEDSQYFEFLSEDTNSFGWQPGMAIPRDEGYCPYMVAGEIPRVVPDTRAQDVTHQLSVTTQARLGAYAGVPIALPGGRLYGALCAVSHEPEPGLGSVDEEVLTVLAALIVDHLLQLETQEADRASRLAEMQNVMAPGAIDIVMQPIVDLRSGRIRGLEALARFADYPNGPAEVFAAGAELGVGADLELAAIEAALLMLPEIPESLYLSLNVSPATVMHPRFGPLLATVPACRIVVELTEHAAVADYDDLAQQLQMLQMTGVRLAIDDTGSGFASLAHILRLAPDIIKLDTTLIRGVDADPARQALTTALVGFAASLGAVLIAEGVETQDELNALRELGVTCGQGYHLGRPARLDARDLAGDVYVGKERRRARPWSTEHHLHSAAEFPAERLA